MRLTEIDIENITDVITNDVLFSSEKCEYSKADCLIIFGCHLKNLLDERLSHVLNLLKKRRLERFWLLEE